MHTPGFFSYLANFYGFYVPLLLLCSWAPLALIDLARREDVDAKKGGIWAAAIIALPFFGAFAYHVAGGSKLPSWVSRVVVFGGLGLLLLMLVLSSVLRY